MPRRNESLLKTLSKITENQSIFLESQIQGIFEFDLRPSDPRFEKVTESVLLLIADAHGADSKIQTYNLLNSLRYSIN